MRIMVRLLDAAGDLSAGAGLCAGIITAGGPSGVPRPLIIARKQTKRTMLCRDLIAVAGSTVGYLRAAAARVSAAACAGIRGRGLGLPRWALGVPLVEQVIEQTERRVTQG